MIAIIGNVLLGLLVFGLSASVEVDAFLEKLQRREGILIGLACQFILLPFCGFLTVVAFRLKDVYGITLLIVTSSPGGSYSNLWCSLFNADLALSVAMTTASTVVSSVMLPLNLIIYISAAYQESGAHKHLNWVALFISIAIVITAVFGGILVSAYSEPKIKVNHYSSFIILECIPSSTMMALSLFTMMDELPHSFRFAAQSIHN